MNASVSILRNADLASTVPSEKKQRPSDTENVWNFEPTKILKYLPMWGFFCSSSLTVVILRKSELPLNIKRVFFFAEKFFKLSDYILFYKDRNTAFSGFLPHGWCSELNLTQCVASFSTQKHRAWSVIQKFISSSSSHTVHILLQEIGDDPVGIRKSSITNSFMTFWCNKFRLHLLQDQEFLYISEHEIWSFSEPPLKKQFVFKYSLVRFHPNQSIWSFSKLNQIIRG